MLLLASAVLFQSIEANSFSSSPAANFALTNTIIDVGQVSVANAVVSGGSNGPYSGEWSWYNANGTNNQVTANIFLSTNADPQSVAFNPSGTLAYIADQSGGYVNITSATTNLLIAKTPYVGNPSAVALNPSGTLAYVTSLSGTVNVIDVASNTVVNTIIVGASAKGVLFNSDGSLAYVLNTGPGSISVIDTATNSVVNTIPNIGTGAFAINPSSTLIYVVSYTNSGVPAPVNVISTAANAIVNTIYVNSGADGVAFSPSGAIAYVADQNPGNVSVINVAANSVVNTISGMQSPGAIAFNPAGTIAYVADQLGSNVTVIGVPANAVIGKIFIGPYAGGSNPASIAFNPSGTFSYIANSRSNNVVVVGDLPETAVQTLSAVQTGNGLMQLSINAVNSNTIRFTFNGVSYTESTGTRTIYGTWSLYGFAQDNGTETYYYGSNTLLLSNAITINPAFSPVSFAISNSILQRGSTGTITATVAGGTPPYRYDFSIYNASGRLVANAIYQSASASNAFSFVISNSFGFGRSTANVLVNDSATPANAQISNTVNFTIVPVQLQTPGISLSANIIDAGQTISITESWVGGTPTYTATLYSSPNPACSFRISTLVQRVSGITGNSVTFNAISPISNTYYCAYLSDNALNPSAAGSLTNGFSSPSGVSIAPSSTYAYITNLGGGGNVVILDTTTNTVVNSITAGISSPEGVAFSPSGTYAYLSNYGPPGNVVIINTATNTVVNVVSGAVSTPGEVAFAPNGKFAYVANYSSTSNTAYYVISTATNSVIGAITNSLFTGSGAAAILANSSYAYVSDLYSAPTGGIEIINTTTNNIVGHISGYNNVQGVAVSPDGTYAYMSPYGSGIYIINTATGGVSGPEAPTVPGSGWPGLQDTRGLGIAPSGAYAYLASYGDSALGILETNEQFGNTVTANVIVDPVLATPTITSSPALPNALYPGQSITFNAAWSGGTAPYTVNYIITNTTSGNVIASALFNGISITSNSFTWTVPSKVKYNTAEVNVVVTDSATVNTVASSTYLQTLSILPALGVVTISPANDLIDAGQHVAFSSSWFGDTPAYTASLYSSSNSVCSNKSTPVQTIGGLTNNSVTFGSVAPTLATYYCVYVTNNALDIPAVGSISNGINVPVGIAFSKSGNYLYVTNRNAGNVVVIDAATNAVVNSIAGFNAPYYMAINANGTLAYVTSRDTNSLYTVNLIVGAVTNVIADNGIETPYGVAASPSGRYLYIANIGPAAGNIAIVNTTTNSVVNSITDGMNGPTGIALSKSGAYMYVSNYYADNVVVINTTTGNVVNSIASGFSHPSDIAISPNGAYAAVVNYGNGVSSNVIILNMSTYSVIGYVNGSFTDATQAAFSPSGNYIYVVNEGQGNVIIARYGYGSATSAYGYISITTAASGGGGGGATSAGGGGGGGQFLPSVIQFKTGNETGYEIYNFTQDNQEKVAINGIIFTLVENFITPSSAGISVNGQTYTLSNGQTAQIAGHSGYYLNLLNISYLPIINLIKIRIYEIANSSARNTTANTTSRQNSTAPQPNQTASGNTIKNSTRNQTQPAKANSTANVSSKTGQGAKSGGSGTPSSLSHDEIYISTVAAVGAVILVFLFLFYRRRRYSVYAGQISRREL